LVLRSIKSEPLISANYKHSNLAIAFRSDVRFMQELILQIPKTKSTDEGEAQSSIRETVSSMTAWRAKADLPACNESTNGFSKAKARFSLRLCDDALFRSRQRVEREAVSIPDW